MRYNWVFALTCYRDYEDDSYEDKVDGPLPIKYSIEEIMATAERYLNIPAITRIYDHFEVAE